MLPTFPFFVTHLGGDAQTIGLATALFSIASIISRSFAGSTFFVAFDLGIALGGYIAGVLVKHFSYDTMFLWMIVPCLVSALCYRLCRK
ncbi:MAG: hypothetical protein ACI31D_01070 [Candidatus Limisoma sp.]